MTKPFARIALLILASAFSAAAQQIPDCSIFFNLTSPARYPTSGFNAGSLQTGCVGWILTYYSTGFTALSLRLDSADDSTGAPGVWGSFAGSTVMAAGCSGSNPLTAASHGCVIVSGANPWVSVDLQSVTGSGQVTGYAFGCRPDHCAALLVPPGSGGGSGPQCNLTAELPLSGTGYTQIIPGNGSTQIHVCNVVYGSGTASVVPVVNGFSLGFGTCSGTVAEVLSLPGISAYADNFNGSLVGTAGAALCAKEAVGNADKVMITYYQQ